MRTDMITVCFLMVLLFVAQSAGSASILLPFGFASINVLILGENACMVTCGLNIWTASWQVTASIFIRPCTSSFLVKPNSLCALHWCWQSKHQRRWVRASRCRLPLSANGEQTGDRFVLSGSLQSTAPDLKSQPPTTLAHEIRGACSDKKGKMDSNFPS